ncbi:hypothetical protein [Amycolatopsis pithecellobii]|uniref:Uncharacterized protein n=1 Tax=Amycolatopsis pithecellobii TaxID=664692 RepID=A0A6N7YTP1_9PSEU|nr:hypothetical protein [Amycolatopsis pithecellobii]MTD55292.1 hypothetical protein [Amycolatopsis pithecellobii]
MQQPKFDVQTYAWNWFSMHANQRMQLVNFWLVAVAFLAAAFVQARMGHMTAIAVGVSVAGALSSLAFMMLDARTRQLVHLGERALRQVERDQADRESARQVILVAAASEVRRSRINSYRVIIEGLQLCIAALFTSAAIYSLVVP